MVGVIPVMVIATVAALDDVPEDLHLCARTLGASPLYALWHVQVRAALPGIITGMRIAMGGAWGSIVAAEMLAATSGVGYLIMQAGDYLNTGIVFSGIITIAAAGLALDAACAPCSAWPIPVGPGSGWLSRRRVASAEPEPDDGGDKLEGWIAAPGWSPVGGSPWPRRCWGCPGWRPARRSDPTTPPRPPRTASNRSTAVGHRPAAAAIAPSSVGTGR